MADFKVLKPFRDKETRVRYTPGDSYSLDDPKRSEDAIRKGILEKIEASPEPLHVGGGWYELPSGERIRGKDEAIARLKAGE